MQHTSSNNWLRQPSASRHSGDTSSSQGSPKSEMGDLPGWTALRKTREMRDDASFESASDSGTGVSSSLMRSVRSGMSGVENQAVLNTSMDCILSAWENGEIHTINKAGEELFGYNSSELFGMSIANLVMGIKKTKEEELLEDLNRPGTPKDAAKQQKVVHQLLSEGCGTRREMSMVKKSGDHIPVMIAVSQIVVGPDDMNEDGAEEQQLYTVVIRDITAEKEFKRQIEMEKRQLFAVVDTMVDAVITMDKDCVIKSFNRAAEKLWKYRSNQVIGQNVKKLMPADTAREHDGYIKRYLDTGEKHVIGKGRDTMAMRSDSTTFPIHLAVSEIKLHGVHLFSAIIRDTTEEKAAKRQIEEDRLRLTAVLDTTPDAIITINPTGTVLSFNAAAERMWGWTSNFIIGQKVNMLMPPSLGVEHDSYLSNYLTTGVKKVIGLGRETTAQRRDCTEFPVHLRVSEVNTTNGRYFSAIIRDITAEQEARRNIQNEQERMGAVLETTVDAIICIGTDGNVQSFNRAAEKMWGWGSTDVIGKKVNMLMPQETGRKHDGYLKTYLATGKKRVIGMGRETMAQRRDGIIFPVHLAVSEVRTEAGLHIFSAIIRDVTQEKAANSLLVEEKQRLNAVLNNTVDAIITMSTRGYVLSFNAAAEKMWGYEAEEVIDEKVNILMPEYIAKAHDKFVSSYIRTGRKKVIGIGRETTAMRKDGSSFPIHLAVSEVKTREGLHIFSAIIRDITAERHAKRLVMEEKQRLAAVLEGTVDAIITITTDGVIMSFNRAAEIMWKMRAAGVVGQKVNILMPQEIADEHDDYLVSYNTTGVKKVIGIGRETFAKRLDGHVFPIHLAVSEVPLESGSIFSAIIRDVTNERTQREQIMKAQAELEEEKMRLSAVVETTVDAIISIDPMGTILSFNTAAVTMFGWDALETKGENVKILMPDEIAAEHDDYLAEYMSGSHPKDRVSQVISKKGLESWGRRKSGERFPIALAVSEVKLEGGTHFFSAIIRDITEIKRQERRLRQEQRRNEELLLNVLPPSIAKRLKSHERPISDGFDSASILFADVVGFTEMSATMKPQEVVCLLNDIFELFDALVDEYGLEKIKTIGDCYMVVAGLPHKRENHAGVLASFALDMFESLAEWNAKRPGGARLLDMRMGLNCGPVVAGVVGKSKFLYDIWGDTVNVASRMESSGIPSMIQVTDEFAKSAKDDFVFELRGQIQVKGKGEMTTFFLKGRSEGSRPRESFMPEHRMSQADRRREMLTDVAEVIDDVDEAEEEEAAFAQGELARRRKRRQTMDDASVLRATVSAEFERDTRRGSLDELALTGSSRKVAQAAATAWLSSLNQDGGGGKLALGLVSLLPASEEGFDELLERARSSRGVYEGGRLRYHSDAALGGTPASLMAQGKMDAPGTLSPKASAAAPGPLRALKEDVWLSGTHSPHSRHSDGDTPHAFAVEKSDSSVVSEDKLRMHDGSESGGADLGDHDMDIDADMGEGGAAGWSLTHLAAPPAISTGRPAKRAPTPPPSNGDHQAAAAPPRDDDNAARHSNGSNGAVEAGGGCPVAHHGGGGGGGAEGSAAGRGAVAEEAAGAGGCPVAHGGAAGGPNGHAAAAGGNGAAPAGKCPVAHGGAAPPEGMSGCPVTQHRMTIDAQGNPTIISQGNGPALSDAEARAMGAAARLAELSMMEESLDFGGGGGGGGAASPFNKRDIV